MAHGRMGYNLPLVIGIAAFLAGMALVHAEEVSVSAQPNAGMTGVRVAQLPRTALSVAEGQKLVEDYVNGLGTLKADFTQRTTGEQFTQEGVFYLDKSGKAGKFLWDYQSPDRQRLIATGTALYFVDDERGGAVTQLPVKAGLSRLFTGQKLSLAKEGLKVEEAWRSGDSTVVRLAVVRDTKAEEGDSVSRIDLTFGNLPVSLQKVEATDATSAVTTVTFANMQAGVALDGKMFKFTPPQYKQ